MDLDDRGIKHEAESMSGVVRGALFKCFGWAKSLRVFEFQMPYKQTHVSKVEGSFRYKVFDVRNLANFCDMLTISSPTVVR